jgi:hypothetical protein
MNATLTLAALAWHHLQFQIPVTWEVVAYKKNSGDGQLVLADRHGETLQVFWRTIAATPKVPALLQKLVEENFPGRFSVAQIRANLQSVGGWDVFLAPATDLPVFAGRYLPDERALLEVTFPPHVQRAPGIVREVLESYRPNTGAIRRWAAFGLDLEIPADYELDEVRPWPAAQRLRFEHRKGYSITAHRYGMLSRQLAHDTLESFFARLKGGGTRIYKKRDFLKGNRYPGVELEYGTRGTGGITSLLSPRWRGHVWVWRCDEQQRLYALDYHAPPRLALPDLIEKFHIP